MIAGLVLAAGLGTRMGSSKPLLDVGGVPGLARVLATIDEARVAPVLVVLGRDADAVSQRVDLSRRHVVVNPAPERGLSSSLALGIAAAPPSVRGLLVFHADMPFIQADTVRSVVDLAAGGARLAAPRYRETRGFPVFLSCDIFPSLLRELHGDAGARAYLERRRDVLRIVDVEDAGCVRDLDRPADLATSAKEFSWTTSA